MYKQASKLKLRFTTSRGVLSAEQLWDTSQTFLTELIRGVKKQLKKADDDELGFLDSTVAVDVEQQLRFDILKDIYLTKKKESEDARNAKDVKERNQKILGIIQEKKEGALKDMSVEELEKMLA